MGVTELDSDLLARIGALQADAGIRDRRIAELEDRVTTLEQARDADRLTLTGVLDDFYRLRTVLQGVAGALTALG